MDAVLLFIGLVIGLLFGLGIGLGIGFWRLRDVQTLTDKLLSAKEAETSKAFSELQHKFDALALEALGKSTTQFLELAKAQLGQHTEMNKQELTNKKSLIDQTLVTMQQELTKVQDMVHTLEKDRKAKFNVLEDQMNRAADETKRLSATTNALHAALTNSRVRGQWGDRMAEDVLRLSGFVEGINYQKQQTLDAGDHKISRPDYTFYLPQNRVVHMDVKFPLENYLAYLDQQDDAAKKQFLKDARARVKEAATRGYALAQDTLDYVLVFIPNEQVYAFLHEADPALLDDALQQKVILCSPMTLYAILAVIRQAVDNFHLERTAGEMLTLLGTFQQQWERFTEAMDAVGKKIDASQQEFLKLTTTRKHQLEKPLRQIEQLRNANAHHITSTGTPLTLIDTSASG